MNVEKKLPLSAMGDPMYRSFSKYQEHTFSSNFIDKVLYALVELIEKKIALEIKKAKRGALLQDGWSQTATHYIGLIASYLKSNEDGKMTHTLALLSVAPMIARPMDDNGDVVEDTGDLMDDESDVEEACNFCAKTMANHFITILNDFYDINFQRWVACLVADSCAVNMKLARV